MNKGELIAAIAERYYFGNKAEAERALKAVSDTLLRRRLVLAAWPSPVSASSRSCTVRLEPFATRRRVPARQLSRRTTYGSGSGPGSKRS